VFPAGASVVLHFCVLCFFYIFT